MMVAEHWALMRMLLVTMAAGYALLRAFTPRGQIPRVAILGLSFPMGMVVMSLICLWLSIMRVELRLENIKPILGVVLVFLLLVGCLMRGKRQEASRGDQGSFVRNGNFRSWPVWQKWTFIALGIYLVYEFYFIVGVAFIFPVQVYDAVVITVLKAKMFFYDGNVDALKFLFLKSYPLMVPFEVLWVVLNLGHWDNTLINVVFPMTYLSFTVFQYCFMREKYGILWALACSALTVSSAFYNYHAAIAYQDFTFMVFNVAAQMLMVMCYRRRDLALLPLAGLCAGLGVFVKLEGVAYLVINTILCCYLLRSVSRLSLIKQVRAFLVFIAPGVVLYIVQAWFVANQGFLQAEGRFAFREHLDLAARIGSMIRDYANVLFLYNNWTMLWAILIAGLLVFGRQAFKDFEARFYGLIIMLTIGMFLTVDILTHNYISHHSVLSRVMLHFYPVLPILIVNIHEGYFRRKTN